MSKKGNKIYISGPISGLEREVYMRNFKESEVILQWEGLRVVNPTQLAPCRWPWLYKLLGYRLTLLYDLWHLMRCDGIYMLDGWQQSKGAKTERAVAEAFGLVIIDE